MKKIRLVFLTFIMTAIFSLPVFAAPAPNVGYIYIGDSRFAYMDKNIAYSNTFSPANANIWDVSVPGEGYGWLSGTATAYVANIKANNPQITKWYEIYGLGVNDLTSIDFYINYYRQRALANKVILVSVNPVQDGCDRATNPGIESFNEKLAATGIPYINCYNYLVSNGFSTYDGTHYTADTDLKIYNYISACTDLYTTIY